MVYRKQDEQNPQNRQAAPAKKKKPKRKKSAGGAIIAILLVLILLVAGAGGFFLMGGKDMLPLFGSAAKPFVAEGDIYALTLKPTGGDITEAGLRSYYQQAIDFATANGINTFIYEGKTDIAVYWRDKTFPLAEEIAAQDTLLGKIDPLEILCDVSKDSGIQIWVQANVYSARGYTSEMKGTVASYAKKLAGAYTYAFEPTDTDYAAYIVDGLTRMAHKYPVAGVVLAGMEAEEGQQIADPALYNASFTSMLQSLKASFEKHGVQSAVALGFNGDGDSWLTPETAATLCTGEAAQYLLPSHAASNNLYGNLQKWQVDGAKLVAVAPTSNAELVLFMAATAGANTGAVLGNYQAGQDTQQLGLLKSAIAPVEGSNLPTGFDIPQTLAVNYPEQGAKIYTTGMFIMGNSNPNLPLYLDGQEITRTTSNGAFGVYVDVQTGENNYQFTQDGAEFTLTVTKPEPSGGGTSTPMPSDTTKEAQPGQAIRINTYIASALTDINDDFSINETFHLGGVAVVQESVQTVRYDSSYGRNVKTWAYKLTSGDYVLAKNCVWIDGDGQSTFDGLTAQAETGGEWITFGGNGTPAPYIAYGNDTGMLEITMYNTQFTLPEGFSSQHVQSATVAKNENSVTLQLQTKDIWGYSLEYADGQTKLFLKKAVVRGTDPTKPLAGVTVMLDPGHGGDDLGTPGLMWQTGPYEKDVNLAVANAVAYRLRQLGAEVIMTRTDDSTLSLDERLAAQTLLKPDFFLSIHHDSTELVKDLNEISGMRAFYHHPYNTPNGKAFAQNMIDFVAPALGRQSAEAQYAAYYVTRTTVCPSILFEYGFLVIPAEFEYATSTEGIYAAAVATADAILATVPEGVAAALPETNEGTGSTNGTPAAAPAGLPATVPAPPKKPM